MVVTIELDEKDLANFWENFLEKIEVEEIEEIREEAGERRKTLGEIERALDEQIIAEKVLERESSKAGRFPRAQVEAIKYIYSKGGKVPVREFEHKFGNYVLSRLLQKKAVYVANIGSEKVVVLEDRAREVLDALYKEGEA